MSGQDKVKNALQKSGGKVKQVAGQVAGRRDTEASGRRKQIRADAKNTGEQMKDAGGKAKRALKH